MQHYVGAGSAVISTTTAHGMIIHANRFASSPAALTISSANAVTCNTSFTNNLDQALKGDVTTIDTLQYISAVKAIQTKLYKRLDLQDGALRVGLIAQDVAAAIPAEWSNFVEKTEETAEHVDDKGNVAPTAASNLTLDYARGWVNIAPRSKRSCRKKVTMISGCPRCGQRGRARQKIAGVV